MKKILSFLVSGALALGLIGCSGDLHDYEETKECLGLYLAGDIQKDENNRAELTFVDANTQTYKFTYDSSKHTYWGGAKGTINFKLVTDATTWTQDFGWKKDTPVYLTLNDDFLTLEARGGANSNPGNVKVENLINGKEYVITVNYDAPNKVAKVKMEGPSIDFPTLKLVDSEGKEYPLTREGTTYSYVWTPAEAGSKSFYVTNGYMFYGADGILDTEKPDAEDYITVSYEANKEYIVEVETAYDQGADVTMYAGINDTTILAKCDVIGGWDGWAAGHKLEKISDDTYQIDFTASASTFEFAIREKADSWATRWFSGIPAGKGKPATAILMDDVEVGGDALTPVYYEEDPGMDGKNIVIKGLSKDSIYTIVIQIKDASKKELSVSCKLKQAVEAQLPNLDGYWLHSNVYSSSWDKDANGEYPKFKATSNPNEYECEFTPYSDVLNFGLSKGEAFGWVAGCGFVISSLDTTVNGSVSGGDNSAITGLTAGSSYILTIKVLDVDGNATAKVSLKA